jgi:ubiquinone/menaquinone biosynthesis C-methylase UbiE
MDHIKNTWAQQATSYGTSHAASWKDIFAMQLEIDTIGQFIKQGDVVLDVGCANGFSTFNQLKRGPKKITGVDYVDEMITYANEQREREYSDSNISFEVGDIRNLRFSENSFDVVYTTRVLINLPTWEEQQQGISECLRVAKSGGIVVFSEAFWEPLVKLNSLRTLAGLSSLVEHDFNRYLKKSKLNSFLKQLGLKFEVIDFSSLYYLGSRFVRELTEGLEEPENYQNRINSTFYELEKKYSNSKDFGIQQAFVVHK